MVSVDIFIINYFSASDTLKAIQYLGPNPSWQFWVLDNSNSDTEWAKLDDQLGSLKGYTIHYERSATNLGFARACNVLFKQSTAPFCLLLNPDARIDRVNLQRLIDEMEVRPECGAIAPLMRWLDDEDWWIPSAQSQNIWSLIWMRVVSFFSFSFQWLWQRYYHQQQRFRASNSYVREDYVTGAILLICRKAALAAFAGQLKIFDENYFMFFEDTDLSIRFKKSNYQLGIASFAYGSHLYKHGPEKDHLLRASQKIFNQSWYSLFSRRILLWLESLPVPLFLLDKHMPKLNSSLELEAFLGEQPLIAWSPSPYRIPAIWRNYHQIDCVGFSENAWNALSPGIYYGVCIASSQKQVSFRWISFEKVKSAY